jgi:hypothetical protein
MRKWMMARRRPARAIMVMALLTIVPMTVEATNMRDGLGVAAGLTTGYGFSYIHHDPSGWATLATGILWKSSERTRYSVGLNIQRTVAGNARSRVYVDGGGAFFHHYVTDFNIGAGIGIEVLWKQSFGVSVDLDEAWLTRKGDVVVAPAASAHYYF